MVSREQRIEEQIAAEIDLLRREALPVGRQVRARAADAGALQRVVELVEVAQRAGAGREKFEARRASRFQGYGVFCSRAQSSARYREQGEQGERSSHCAGPSCARSHARTSSSSLPGSSVFAISAICLP